MKLASLLALAGAALASPIQLTPRDGSFLGFDYANEKVHGVNLGGWFVLEPFITPSLFEAFGSNDANVPVDEYHYTQWLGKDEAEKRLQEHWSSWITEEDIKAIAENYKLNLVRIPIGYWAFTALPGDPYVQGQEAYLDKALGWCRKYGLKAWVDLHGTPGSQNGFDNSGLRDQYQWPNGDNVQQSINTISYMATKYGAPEYNDVVVGIELVNEPLGPSIGMEVIENYFKEGFWTVRHAGSDTGVVIHDAFMPKNYFDKFMTANEGFWNVVLDHHQYQVFSPGELSRNVDQHVQAACQIGWESASEYHWRVFGEWSAALTDCTHWLNGVGKGARLDGSFPGSYYQRTCQGRDDISSWSQQDKEDSRRYVEAQLDAYEHGGGGWIYWTYKTENAIEWDFRRLVDNGIFPFPYWDRHHPNQCGF